MDLTNETLVCWSVRDNGFCKMHQFALHQALFCGIVVPLYQVKLIKYAPFLQFMCISTQCSIQLKYPESLSGNFLDIDKLSPATWT